MHNVLIVDDNAVDRRLTGGLVEKQSDLQVAYANDGAMALEQLQSSVPDLIVTDLQMPELDGLQLVSMVRMQFPHVPVILITAKGSEALAVDALEHGAAGYVPKALLSEKLLETINEVLVLASAEKHHSRLMECQLRVEFCYALENDPSLIDALVDYVQQTIEGMRFCDHTDNVRLGVALRESLLNALYWGNLQIDSADATGKQVTHEKRDQLARERFKQPPYRDRRITVDGRITSDQARFTVKDEGDGFDHTPLLSGDSTQAIGSLGGEQGRGLVLMQSFMDEVSFNESGNEVVLVKRGNT